jgi:hypothetical protein
MALVELADPESSHKKHKELTASGSAAASEELRTASFRPGSGSDEALDV